jgi:NAD kinase
MNNAPIENALIIKSKTRLEQLIRRFNTQAQAKFYINQSKEQFYTKKKKAPKIFQQAQKIKQADVQQVQNIEEVKNIPPFLTENEQQMQTQQAAEIPYEETEQFQTMEQPEIPQAVTQESVPRLKTKKKYKQDTGDFSDYEAEHNQFQETLNSIQKEASKYLKTKILEREFLSNYMFSEHDLVIVVGQDGLVANTAKYVNDIPIIAINPDKERFDGILLPFEPSDLDTAVNNVLSGNYRSKRITMAEVTLNDEQKLLAFNDLFIGPEAHTSARYQITFNGESENHSSSGIIVSTGAGSTGWLSSLYNMAKGINRFAGGSEFIKITPMEMDSEELVFIVREPFLSRTSQTGITAGRITRTTELIIESHMASGGVIFSDGIISDYLKFNSGAIATIRIADQKAVLVEKG